MPETLQRSPDKQPPSGGGMFSADDIAALQRNLEANRRAIDAQTTAEINSALQSGELGKSAPDMALPLTQKPAASRLEFMAANPSIQDRVRAVRAERAARGIVDAPIEGLEESPTIAPMSAAEIADIAAGPRVSVEATQAHLENSQRDVAPVDNPYARKSRRIYMENPDGTMMTDEQFAASRAKYDAEQAEKGAKTSAEQRADYLATKAEQEAADNELLSSMKPELLEASLEKYGREGTLAILKGDSEVPKYTGPENSTETFTHASTGESMTQSQVEERLSEIDASRLGQAASGLAREARSSKKPFRSELVDTDDGLINVETGQLDNELDMQITTSADGSIASVEVIVRDEGEVHEVGIMAPESDAPIVLVDGEPATQEDAQMAEAVIEEARAAIEARATTEQLSEEKEESRQNEQTEVIEGHDKQTEETTSSEVDASSVVDKEVALSSDLSLSQAEIGLANVEEEPNTVDVTTPDVSQEPEAVESEEAEPQQAEVAQPVERPRPQPLTPEQRQRRMQMEAMNFVLPILNSNRREFTQLFHRLGVDLSEIKASNVQLDRNVYQHVDAIQKIGVRKFIESLQHAPDPHSALGRDTIRNQELARGLARAMFKPAQPRR